MKINVNTTNVNMTLIDGHKRRPDHLEWCQGIFDMVKEGGVWGVPRSGIVFTKRGDKLVLTELMPHDDTMPITAEKLRAYQQDDYQNIKAHFESAGIPIESEVEW